MARCQIHLTISRSFVASKSSKGALSGGASRRGSGDPVGVPKSPPKKARAVRCESLCRSTEPTKLLKISSKFISVHFISFQRPKTSSRATRKRALGAAPLREMKQRLRGSLDRLFLSLVSFASSPDIKPQSIENFRPSEPERGQGEVKLRAKRCEDRGLKSKVVGSRRVFFSLLSRLSLFEELRRL